MILLVIRLLVGVAEKMKTLFNKIMELDYLEFRALLRIYKWYLTNTYVGKGIKRRDITSDIPALHGKAGTEVLKKLIKLGLIEELYRTYSSRGFMYIPHFNYRSQYSFNQLIEELMWYSWQQNKENKKQINKTENKEYETLLIAAGMI